MNSVCSSMELECSARDSKEELQEALIIHDRRETLG
jgi:hypothetical protein